MKNLAFLIVIIVMLSCNNTKNIAASSIGLVPLDNYFVKNNVTLTDDTTYEAITSNVTFENNFGVAKTMDNKIITPDFNGQTVVAVILKPTNKNVSVKLLKATLAGKDLNIYYSISNNGADLTYTQTPTAIATVPRALDAKNVNFFSQDVKVKTIPLVY